MSAGTGAETPGTTAAGHAGHDGRGAMLGVDIGTSSSKGVLVSPDGALLATAVREHTVQRPAPGHVEMDARIWWDEFVSLTAELTAAVPGTRVDGIGVSGMGPCVLLADADGEPVRPAILYGVDSRAEAEIGLLTAELGADAILERCGGALSAQSAGPKVAWVARNEPEAYARARHLFMPASFLAHRLTGAYVLDHASAGQSAPMYDARARAWDPEWSRLVAPGLPLPELRYAEDEAGRVTAEAAAALPGIEAGTPVVTGSIDAWAESVSVGVREPGDAMLMYGTTTFLVAATAGPVPSRELFSAPGLRAGTSTLAGGMAASGAITTWLRDLCGEADVQQLVAEAAERPAGANGLLMLPYVAGERSPMHDPSARGVIAGLTLSHTRGDLYRAVLEAAAYGVRHHLEVMEAAGAPVTRLIAVGGGTRSGLLWPRIVSDVTGLTQQIPARTVGASYGTSLLAAGLVHGTDTSRWNPIVQELQPDPSTRERYDEMYALYRELYPATRPVAHALAGIQAAG